MATRSNIAQLLPDGRVKVIYCHCDGYPEGVGRMLEKHYNTPDRVNDLMALGGLWQLRQYLYPTGPHIEGAREPRVTIALGRDCGEPDRQAHTHTDRAAWRAAMALDIEYCYLWLPRTVTHPETGAAGGWLRMREFAPCHND